MYKRRLDILDAAVDEFRFERRVRLGRELNAKKFAQQGELLLLHLSEWFEHLLRRVAGRRTGQQGLAEVSDEQANVFRQLILQLRLELLHQLHRQSRRVETGQEIAATF